METREPFSAKAINHDLFFKPSYVNPTDLLNNANSKKGYYQLIHPYMKNCHYDEPIDLTQGQNKRIKLEESHGQYGASTASLAPAQQVAVKPPNLPNFSRPKGRKSKFYGQENVITDNRQLEHFFKHVLDHQTTETKQTEILKAAKSLFSKRTRTLYHWMYPNTPKQYIKTAVANSWDNLSTQEKQFYISQVLVRFGFPQCNLMVNPQLGGIKDLQPLPEIIGTPSSRELQTAVSSISNGEASSNAHVVPQQEAKRRQGRPMGSKNRNKSNQNGKSDDVAYKMTKDFQDDPELSKELEKFAISFDCFK